MANYTVPGIFIEPEPKRVESIGIDQKCLTGFIGITEKGSLHKGVRITSFQQFKRMFGGFVNYGYLAYAVYGFFSSGGTECIVVRTAHESKNDKKNNISSARMDLEGTGGEQSFRIKALSEGTWGNAITIRLWHTNSETTLVKKRSPLYNWEEWIQLESAEEFSLGDTICIRGKNRREEYRKVVKTDNDYIHLNARFESNFKPEEEDIFCENVRFNLSISYGKKTENYFYVSANETDDKYFVNEVNNHSKYVNIYQKASILTGLGNTETSHIKPGINSCRTKSNANSIELLGSPSLPKEVGAKNLSKGRNGVLGLTPVDFIGYFKGLDNNKGIGIFESIKEISLIAAPDVILFDEVVHKDKEQGKKDIFSVQSAIVNQCERLGNRFAILDVPDIPDVIEMMEWTGKFDTSAAAVYYPRIEIVNPDDGMGLSTEIVLPSGHIAGVYAKTDLEEGIFQAPANKYLNGAIGITHHINNEEYEIIYPKGINILRAIPGRGVKIWGARTLSSDISWRYINVRRTFSAISEAIRTGTQWAVFETNNQSLQKRVVRHVTAFLLDLWRKGYLAGVVTEDGFYVKCDDELNPPEDIDAGILRVEIGISIAKPAEFLVMQIKSDFESGMITVGD